MEILKTSQDETVRLRCITGLGELEAEEAVDLLIVILQDPKESEELRLEAVSSLGAIKNQRALEPLLKTLDFEAERIRRRAVSALGKLGNSQALAKLKWVQEHDQAVSKYRDLAGEAIQAILAQET